MRKDFYKAILVIFLLTFSQTVFGQCPTISGTSFSIDPAECIGGSEGRIIVTITGLNKNSTFNLYSGANGTSAVTGVTYFPIGGAIGFGAIKVLTITGVQANTYNIRYQTTGCNFSGGSNPNPLLSSINVAGPAPANTGAVNNICLSTGAQFLSGSSPASKRNSIGTWTLSPTIPGIFSNVNDTSAILYNLTTPGTYTLTWSVSIAGCNPSSLTTSSTNFDVVKDPDITSTLTGNVCSGSPYNYTITSTIIGSSMPLTPTFTWSRSATSGISNAANSGSTSTINETLINTTGLPVDVLYTLQATTSDIDGFGDVCSGPYSVLTVTVLPAPVANYTGQTTYCSNSLINLSITSNIIGTNYTWTTSVTSGFVNGQSGGSGSLISQNLTGSGTMVYIVSPLVGTTSCPGAQLLIPVTVNPLPTITGLSAPAICSGDNTAVTWSVNPAVAAAFTWTAAYPAGLSGAASGSASTITIPVTNITANTLTGTFTITPTISGTGCVGPSTTVSQIVYPLPLVTSTTPGAICSGTAFTRTLTSNIPVSGFTIIRLANPNVLETATTATFSGTSINHVLTGITGNVETVQYTIIPISATNCTGAGVTFNVTVNPTPTITGFTMTTICSGFATNIVPNTFPATGSVFTWTAAVQSGSATGFSNQPTTVTGPIIQTLNGNGIVRYSVTPNLNGCVGPLSIADQHINPTPTFTGIATPATICLGSSSILSVSGTLNYTWSPSGTLSSATGNPVTATPVAFGVNTYSVTGISSITGCQFSTSVSVTVVNPTTPGIIFSGNGQTYCLGSTIPGITVTATSGIIGLYENGVLVSSGASPLNYAPNTATGSHTYNANVTLTGCPGPMSASVSYTVAAVPTISGNNASICGLNPVNLSVSSNASSFVWSGSASTTASATITPAAFGNNQVTITGTLGSCSITTVITVTAFVIPTVAGNNVTVCGLTPTTLTVAGNGLNYIWSNGSVGTTSGVITPGSFGTSSFTVTATSAICSSTATVSLTALPSPTISGNNVSICGLNPVNVTVNSNAASFAWSASASSTASATITPASFGNNIVTVTGIIGTCNISAVLTVTAFAVPTVAGNNITICGLSAVTLTVAGNASSYIWSNGAVGTSSGVITPGSFGTSSFTVTATSAICSSTATLMITALPPPTVAGSNMTVCGFLAATLTVTGNAAGYAWSNGGSGTSVSAVPAGPGNTLFTVTATSGLCNATATLTVTSIATPTITGTNSATVCSGMSTTLSVTGATSYLWSTGATTSSISVSPSSTTSFSVTGLSAGCNSNTLVIPVTVNPVPTITGANPAPICQGLSTTLTVSGATQYSWSPATFLNTTIGSTVIATPTASVSYLVTGTTNGCVSTHTIFVAVNVASLPPSPPTPQNFCVNGPVSALATGAITMPNWYNVSTGGTSLGSSFTPPVTAVGTQFYWLSQNTNGCESNRIMVTVNITGAPTLAGANTYTTCAGQDIALAVSGATSYTWAPLSGSITVAGGNAVANLAASQIYSITGSNGSGCNAVKVITVTVNALPVIGITGNTTICSGMNTSLLASGANAYLWQPGSITFNPLLLFSQTSTTTYTVTGTNTTTQCSADKSITVVVIPTLSTPTVPSGPVSFCGPSLAIDNYSSTILNATATGWSISAGSSSIDASGNVTWDPNFIGTAIISVTGYGCSGPKSNSLNVSIFAVPTITGIASTDPSNCSTNDGSITVTGVGNAPLQYSNGFASNGTGIFTSLSSGTPYTIQLLDVNGCAVYGPTQNLNGAGQPATPAISAGGTYGECNALPTVDVDAGTVTGIIGIYIGLPLTDANRVASISGSSLSYLPTTVPGTYDYYANITVAGCVSAPAGPSTYVIDPAPAPVTITSSLNYCQSDPAPAAITTAANSPTEEWYDQALTTLLWVGPGFVPDVSSPGVFVYKLLDRDGNNCVSPILTVNVTVTSSSVAPCSCSSFKFDMTGLFDVPICNNEFKEHPSTIALTGGTMPYTIYLLDPLSTVSGNIVTINGVNSTSYNISITGTNLTNGVIVANYSITGIYDVNGCKALQNSGGDFGFTHYPSPTITGINQPAAVCQGNTIDITTLSTGEVPSSGGTKSYYDIFTNANQATPVGALADPTQITASGTYFYRYDADPYGLGWSCWAIAPINVSFTGLPSAAISVFGSSTICGGEFTNLKFDFTGSTPNFDLTYNDGSSNITINSISANSFTTPVSPSATSTYSLVSVTGGSGCSNTLTGSATITVRSAFDPLCTCDARAQFIPGNNLGSKCEGSLSSFVLPISVSGSNVNGVELLQNGGNPIQFTGLTPDVNNFVTVTVNPSFTTTYVISQVFTATCAGTGIGIAAEIDVNPTPSLTGSNLVNASCGQSIDLTTVLSDVNSTPGVTTYWTDATATNPLSNPNAVSVSGVYYVKKQSVPGCSDIQPVQIVFPSSPTANIVGSNSICAGNPAPINILFNGGDGTYTFTYTDGTTPVSTTTSSNIYTAIQNPTTTTTYTLVSVTDGSGCIGTLSGAATISMLPPVSCSGCALPAVPALSMSQISVTGVAATWSNSSGAVYYQFDLATDAGFTNLVAGASGFTTTGLSFNTPNLAQGFYFGRVIAFNACGSVSGMNIVNITTTSCTLPSVPAVSLSQVSVAGIAATWTNSSGAVYYQFDLATDAGFNSLVAGASGITTTGLSFNASGLAQGAYFGRVIAFNACGSVSGMNTVTITSSQFVTTILGTQTIPVGGFAVLTVILSGNGPFTNIQIDYGDPFNTIFRPSAAGMFTLTVNPSVTTTYVVSGYSDGGNTGSGPGISATVTPISPQTPTVTISAPYTASCASGGFLFSANVSGLGGGTPNYTWLVNGSVSGQSFNTATISLSGVSQGDIVSVLVSVTGGLVTTTTATSNVIAPTVTNQIATLSYLPVSCIGGSDGAIIISISSGNAGRTFSYFMNTVTGTISGAGVISNVTPALFVLTIQDNLNPTCTQILTGNPGLADFQVIKSSVNPSCAGNDGSMSIGVVSLVHSNYNVTIRGISLTDTTIVLSNLTTSSSLQSVQSTHVSKLKYGIYSTQFEYGSCLSGLFIDTLTGAQPPIADLGLDSLNVCQYQQFTLTTVGLSGGSYSWFRNDTLLAQIPSNSITLVADRSAKYTVNVPGNNGCVASDVIQIHVSKLTMKLVSTQYSNQNSINVKWSLFNVNGFPGDSLTIQRRDATPFIGAWTRVGAVLKSDSVFVNTSVPTDQIVYQYRVIGTNNNVCTSDEHSDILLKGINDESAPSVSLMWNSYKTWNVGIKEYQIWGKTDEETEYKFIQSVPDTFVTFTDVTKGFNLYYRVLAVSNDPVIQDSLVSWSNPVKLHFSREVTRFNAFSPNGDGNNEYFVIKNIESYPNSELTVLNRWGTRVYYSKPYRSQWNGDGCTDGTYFYLLDLGNGTPIIKDNVLIQR